MGTPIEDIFERFIKELKPKSEWDILDNEGSETNARALYNIFNGVSLDKFCKIATYKRAKEL